MTPDVVVQAARSWVGKHFAEGQSEQCAYFVRHVFSSVGIRLPVTTSPRDSGILVRAGISPLTAPGLANSFSGPDVGDRFDTPQPGDLVMFCNTYGEYPPGVITHVGIVTGNGQMVDRSTSSAPVRERPISTFAGPYLYIRPHQYSKPNSKPVEEDDAYVKLFFDKGKFSIVVHGQTLKPGVYPVSYFEGKMDIAP